MSRTVPEIMILDSAGNRVGAIHTVDLHTAIYANRVVSYEAPLSPNKLYQIHFAFFRLYKDYCPRCATEHNFIDRSRKEGSGTLQVKLLRTGAPFALTQDFFIYNEVVFGYV